MSRRWSWLIGWAGKMMKKIRKGKWLIVLNFCQRYWCYGTCHQLVDHLFKCESKTWVDGGEAPDVLTRWRPLLASASRGKPFYSYCILDSCVGSSMEHIWFSKRTNEKGKKRKRKLRKVVFFHFEKKEKEKRNIIKINKKFIHFLII